MSSSHERTVSEECTKCLAVTRGLYRRNVQKHLFVNFEAKKQGGIEGTGD